MKYLVIILIPILFIACSRDEDTHKRIANAIDYSTLPDQIGWNIEVVFVDTSFTKAILNATKARVFQKQSVTYLDSGLTVRFYSRETGKKISTLTADSAKIDDRTRDMTAEGNVVVISDSSHIKLQTNVLQWIALRQKLYSSEYVVITTPNEIIRGYGFESDPNLVNYKIMRVSGIQYIKEERQ